MYQSVLIFDGSPKDQSAMGLLWSCLLSFLDSHLTERGVVGSLVLGKVDALDHMLTIMPTLFVAIEVLASPAVRLSGLKVLA
jgi:hypothetical protein